MCLNLFGTRKLKKRIEELEGQYDFRGRALDEYKRQLDEANRLLVKATESRISLLKHIEQLQSELAQLKLKQKRKKKVKSK